MNDSARQNRTYHGYPVVLAAMILAHLSFVPRASAQLIQTVAGNGIAGFNGDGSAGDELNNPFGMTVDSNGTIYIADTENSRIRVVNPGTAAVTVAGVSIAPGAMVTVAGTGTAGFSGDGGLATNAQINQPFGVAVDTAGNIYIADLYNYRVRRVSASGIITTVTGNDTGVYGGDNGPAANATLYPYAVAVDKSGNLYIGDTINQRVRAVNMGSTAITVGNVAIQPGFIETVAGNGATGAAGDNGPATSAQLDYPYSVAIDGRGNIYICDTYNRKMRAVNTGTSPITVATITIQPGNIATIAGDGTYGYKNSGSATKAEFADPDGIAVDSVGNIYISDLESETIRLVSNATGLIRTIAGVGGQYGYNGDNIPALTAFLAYPRCLTVDASGNVYFADQPNQRIRKVVVNPAAATFLSANNAGFLEGTQKNFAIITNYWPTPSLSVSGTLPIGLSFSDNGDGTGILGGTPAAGTHGVYNISFTASNGVFPDVMQNFALTVYPPGGLSVASVSQFISEDSSTGGNWLGLYGTDGYSLAGGSQVIPGYASFALQNELNYTWTNSTSDPRALLTASGAGRIAAAWYSAGTFTINLNMGATAHKFSLYPLDWDYNGRLETIQILDAASGFPLDTEVVSNFASGVYLSWNITGSVQIVITCLRGPNAVVSGAFFGGGGGGGGISNFVINKTLGTLRNNYSGWVGMAITIGSNALPVNALGRFVAAGNSGSHTVKIVNGSTGADVPGASVSISTAAGTPGTFQYGNLSSPVTLTPGSVYYVLSLESAGGDQWYDHDTTVQTASVASLTSAAYGTGSPYLTTGTAGQTYVPLDFVYGSTGGSPVITQQPQSATVTLGQSTNFTVSATSGTALSYQWQSQAPGASNFTNIPGATSATYTTPAAQTTNNGTEYLCIVSNSAGSISSNAATLTVQPPPPPTITQEPQNATVSVGQAATFSVGAVGTGLTYQWFSLPSGASGFTAITGAMASTYTTPPAQASDTGTQFECVVSNVSEAVTSNPATLTVRPPGSATPFLTSEILGTVRNNFTGWVGMTIQTGSNPVVVNALGRIVVSGNSASHLVKIVNGSTGADLQGGSVSVPTVGLVPGNFSYASLASPVTLSANATYYVVSLETNGGDQWYDHDTAVHTTSVASVTAPVYSSGSSWTISGGAGQTYGPVDFEYGATSSGPPVITQQPQGATVIVGQSATFSVAATSGTPLTYQWQSQASGASVFSNISGATSSSYSTPPSQATDNGTQFLCVVTNSSTSVSSNAATLTVQPPSSGTPYVLSTVLGTLRNNYTGWVGMSISVNASPLTITALGRMFAPGNSLSHAVKIVNAATGADVSGGSVSIAMSGGTAGSFLYGSLSAPLVLNANTTYYVLTQETLGGDQWYDFSNTSATTNWVAALNGGVYGTAAPYTTTANSAGHMYGPVDLVYSVPPTNYIISSNLGTLRNNFTGWVGMAITIRGAPLSVSQLGRMVAPGNSATHVVKLVSASGTDIAGGSVTVTTSGATVGSFTYAPLSAPVPLSPNTTYYLLSQETSGTDLWYDLDTTLQTVNVASDVSAIYGSGSPYTAVGGSAGHSYGPLDFQFK